MEKDKQIKERKHGRKGKTIKGIARTPIWE